MLPLNTDYNDGSKRWGIAKCRLIIVGFHNPYILALKRTSEAPQLQTINVLISVSAGLRHKIGLADLEEAFLHGKRTDGATQRRPPWSSTRQLLRLEVEVYGTVRGSANWRETIRQYILELGYVQTDADAGVFILFILEPETCVNPKQLPNPFTWSGLRQRMLKVNVESSWLLMVSYHSHHGGRHGLEQRASPNADAKNAREVSCWQVSHFTVW